MNYNYLTCTLCGGAYISGDYHDCSHSYKSFPYVPPSLDTNPLFLALLKRIENLEQRINDLQSNGSENKVATLTYG